MAKRRNSRFRRGSGCYMCQVCSVLTRETGKYESEVGMCVSCFEGKPGDEIALSCRLMTETEFVERHGEHSEIFKKYGELPPVKKSLAQEVALQ